MALRAPLLPKETDQGSRYLPAGYVAAMPAASLRSRTLIDAVSAQAAIFESAGDATGFKTLVGDWEKVLAASLKEPAPSMIDVLVLRVALNTPAKGFERSALALGLTEEAARWRERAEWFAADKKAREMKDDDYSQIRKKGSMLAGLTLPVVAKQSLMAPPISEEELTPGRMADHEFLSQALSIAVWASLALMMLAAGLYHFRGGMLIRRLSRSLEALLTIRDQVWIIGGGILLPFLAFLAICRFSPLNGRHWSPWGSEFIIPTGGFTAMGLIIIVAPVAIARWRLGKRAGFLGFARSRVWTGWLAIACGLLGMAVLGWSFLRNTPANTLLIAAGILLTVIQLVWLVIGLRAFASRRPEFLRRVILSRAVIPAYAAGMLLMVASVPVYHALECQWVAKDELMRLAPEQMAMNRYEARVSQAMKRELQELLEKTK